ncbi:hypothetical protein [Candidatus Phytoplasma pruni]|uniref:Uncharacterized protein n=1 Tax=Candidatus Phytoplasma pruni TaxID=479893 RepID=A0A851HBW1_9MOLU|nr:hypothetical protein [Candidatus Phytoplasma pruni]NWN45565.1 hypothetical protein [Candidatus Phytoplasma pruni]
MKLIFAIYWSISIISFYYYLHYVDRTYNLLCTTLMIVVGMIIDVFGLIVMSLLWVNTLDQLDRFIEDKIEKKHEYLIINLLFLSFSEIFSIIVSLVMDTIQLIRMYYKDN